MSPKSLLLPTHFISRHSVSKPRPTLKTTIIFFSDHSQTLPYVTIIALYFCPLFLQCFLMLRVPTNRAFSPVFLPHICVSYHLHPFNTFIRWFSLHHLLFHRFIMYTLTQIGDAIAYCLWCARRRTRMHIYYNNSSCICLSVSHKLWSCRII